MTISKHSPIFVAQDLLETRYKGAEVIFVAGSVMRGEAVAHSDLDLVIVYPHLAQAYRESFYRKEWPVEAFVHDPQTMHYFFEKIDTPEASSTLAEMVFEGLEVPGPSEVSLQLKSMAQAVLQQGPPPMTGEQNKDLRYHISELLDDIREPRNRQEQIASGVLIYNELMNFYFRSRNIWTSHGKIGFRKLKKVDAKLAMRFSEAFDLLFASGQAPKVVEIAQEILEPQGGFLFDGYERKVPATWRIS